MGGVYEQMGGVDWSVCGQEVYEGRRGCVNKGMDMNGVWTVGCTPYRCGC